MKNINSSGLAEIKTCSMIDFTTCSSSGRVYNGSERKDGIVHEGKAYMLKFPKMFGGVKSLSHVSEYLGSNIMASLGLCVHETLLGVYEEQECVACKDFIAGTDCVLVDFASTVESSFDIDKLEFDGYSYEDILELVKQHTKFSVSKEQVIERFWKMYVCDALLGNFDRHGMNWGFLKSDVSYELAPIYDNGSCLFPRVPENQIESILNDEGEMKKRTFTFPTSQIRLHGEKSSYYDVLKSKMFPECDEASEWLIRTIDLNSIGKMIDSVDCITNLRKEFYKQIIKYRFSKLFLEVFD